jgi:hypothetical protein
VADLSQDRREVRILAMGVDTTTPTGKLVINVVGAIRLSLSASEGIAKVTCEGKYRGRAPTALVRLAYLRRRCHVLEAAVMMGTLGGVATSCAALLLFVGTLRDRPGVSLFVAFGLALLFTMGALVAFLIEMLLASRGLRDQANYANEVGEMHELAAEGVGEPTHGEPG